MPTDQQPTIKCYVRSLKTAATHLIPCVVAPMSHRAHLCLNPWSAKNGIRFGFKHTCCWPLHVRSTCKAVCQSLCGKNAYSTMPQHTSATEHLSALTTSPYDRKFHAIVRNTWYKLAMRSNENPLIQKKGFPFTFPGAQDLCETLHVSPCSQDSTKPPGCC